MALNRMSHPGAPSRFYYYPYFLYTRNPRLRKEVMEWNSKPRLPPGGHFLRGANGVRPTQPRKTSVMKEMRPDLHCSSGQYCSCNSKKASSGKGTPNGSYTRARRDGQLRSNEMTIKSARAIIWDLSDWQRAGMGSRRAWPGCG